MLSAAGLSLGSIGTTIRYGATASMAVTGGAIPFIPVIVGITAVSLAASAAMNTENIVEFDKDKQGNNKYEKR